MQTKKLYLLCWLLFYQMVEDLACWLDIHHVKITHHGTGSTESQEQEQKHFGYKKKKPNREHWIIPVNQTDVYDKWISEYKSNQTKEQEMNETGVPPQRLHLPESWRGSGKGYTGMTPPPWAIMPEEQGKPDYCFMDPHKGSYCTSKFKPHLKRWGYNSFKRECYSFNYSGCGGNVNNFMSQARCEEECMNPIQNNCQKSGESLEYVTFTGR